MHTILSRTTARRLSLAAAAVVAIGASSAAHAAITVYTANLDGASEASPNASPATGFVEADVDDDAHTLRLLGNFSGLLGTSTAAHIHAPTALPGTGTAGVATATPSFAGFPTGVTAGSFDSTLDLTSPASYNSSFVTANGGTAAGAEAVLLLSLEAGTAYFNIHSSVFAGGEIRGFLTRVSVPATETTWGRTKALYR